MRPRLGLEKGESPYGAVPVAVGDTLRESIESFVEHLDDGRYGGLQPYVMEEQPETDSPQATRVLHAVEGQFGMLLGESGVA